MKKILPVLFCCFFFLKLPAQPYNSDSLTNIIISASTEDQRIDAVLLLLDKYESADQNDSTMYYAREMQKLGQKYQLPSIEILSYAEMGYMFYRLDNKPKSLEISLKALKMAEALGNPRVMLVIYNPLALTYSGSDKAIEYFKKALQLPSATNTYKERFWILNNLSREFIIKKQYDSALLFAQQANQLILNKNYNYGLRFSLLRLGSVYMNLNQDELALTYLRLGLKEAVKHGSNYALRNAYLTIGSYYDRSGKTDSAFFYTKMGLDLAMNEPANVRIAPSHAIFKYYQDLGKQDSALKYLTIYTESKDSATSIERMQKMKSLELAEELRQADLIAEARSAASKRNHDLQYAAIAIALISFIIFFFALSRSIIVKPKFIAFFTVLGLLAVFEFINLFIHPYLARLTRDSPILMLMILISIGALLIPLHHKVEQWLTHVMVEKNKKIRLAAAKKTIATLEGGTN